ncbi:beta-propeller fold lactonase family protein [Streptomyces sp. M19]
MDPGTGALRVRHSTDAPVDPSYLALAPGGGVLYAVSETAEGAAAAFDVTDAERPPAPLGDPVPVRGAAPPPRAGRRPPAHRQLRLGQRQRPPGT